jgi:hypothetical protein
LIGTQGDRRISLQRGINTFKGKVGGKNRRQWDRKLVYAFIHSKKSLYPHNINKTFVCLSYRDSGGLEDIPQKGNLYSLKGN